MAKYCSACGTQLGEFARFCPGCGTAVAQPTPVAQAATERLSPGIPKGADGKYHWACELNLWKNPTLLFMLWKIFCGIFIGLYLFLILLDAGRYGLMNAIEDIGLLPIWLLLGMLAFTSLGYAVYALIMGGTYCVLFEMDESGVKHTQLPRQFKKAQVIGLLGALLGAATGNFTTMGTGILTASRQSMHTDFAGAKRIIAHEKRGVIKLNGTFTRNQVYTEAADFDAVLAYIRARCGAKPL